LIRFELNPYDILLFRDGRPLGLGGRAYSIFPPFPSTFQGALRAKLWANQDFPDFEKDWLNSENPTLEFYGSFLKKGDEIFFPLPANILKKIKKEEIQAVSIPIKESKFIKSENTNIEIEKLPWVYTDKDVELASGFISLSELKNWLLKESYLPTSGIVFLKDIFSYEERIGIRMEYSLHTVKKEDGLFGMRFIKLENSVSFLFWIKAEKNENILKQIFESPPEVIILGGERKTANYKVKEDSFFDLFSNLKDKIKAKVKENKTLKVLFLTPAIFNSWKPENNVFNKLELISCVLGRPLDIGGWDLKENRPKPMRKAIPAGSVFWFRVKKKKNSEEVFENLWLKFNSRYESKLGFGLTVVGV